MTVRHRYLSLGAGVQSSAVLLLAARGEIPPFTAAVFADTGWEPSAVYKQLDRLERIAVPAGIPVVRVSAGNIRADALDPAHRFASMPLFTLGPGGERGMARRQCTSEYKIKPIKAEVRRRLGYPHPARVPTGVVAEIAIGISVDEVHRARDADVAYMRNVFPLLDLGWRRGDCVTYLEQHGLSGVGKSSCLGCPFHDDHFWASLWAGSPAEWADAVAFDAAIRHGSARANADGHPLRGQFFLHRQRVPLDQVVLRPKSAISDTGDGDGDAPGCGPWTCPHPSDSATEPATEAPAEPLAGRSDGRDGVREVA
ncbi:hypothetical protein GCM10020218_068000 [Dactylosporangium vinaceum]|uniref:Phosphoadenosine phosphosulfate reductase n=1 Tax=Dactylosporangium vinaceum TaxID=53362 RepID=A0ABV5M2N1_9ACTN|nr:hypothetical protein [Dactylosporangium vinaceum]